MSLWQHFQSQPITWLVVTLVVFLLASWLNSRAGKTPFLHPVLLSLSLIILLLYLTNTDYPTYMQGAVPPSFAWPGRRRSGCAAV